MTLGIKKKIHFYGSGLSRLAEQLFVATGACFLVIVTDSRFDRILSAESLEQTNVSKIEMSSDCKCKSYLSYID